MQTTIKKAAGDTAANDNSRPNYSNLFPLIELRKAGAMPRDGLIWLGLGCQPKKRNALALDPNQLPTDEECKCVAGLDVVLLINGFVTRYGALRRLCGSLLANRPRRLQVIDLDYSRVAYLKMGGSK